MVKQKLQGCEMTEKKEIMMFSIDLEKNRRKYYRLELTRHNDTGSAEVVREWGRIGGKGREERCPFASAAEAEHYYETVLRLIRRRGYKVV